MASSHGRVSSETHSLPTIYAIPAQSDYNIGGGPGTSIMSYAEHELLRSRKTPHGRIDEHFEPFSLDRNVQVPASKHVLLSVSPQSLPPRKQFSYPQHHANGRVSMTDQYTRGRATDQGPTLLMKELPRQPRDYVGGVDSALQQPFSVQHDGGYYRQGSHVPTVLPTILNAHLGPTASAAQQYYGPYWPDGTFSPYRPAPIRDEQFFSHGPYLTDIYPAMAVNTHPPHRHGRLSMNRGVGGARSEIAVSQHVGSHEYLPFHARALSSGKPSNIIDQNSDPNENLDEASPGNLATNLGSAEISYGNGRRPWIALSPGEASKRIAFRDRTFQWAHQVYVNLLSKIQRENKLGRPAPSTAGHHKLPAKPSIFPKPPQRSGSYFTDSLLSTQISNPDRKLHGFGERPWANRQVERIGTTNNLSRHKAFGQEHTLRLDGFDEPPPAMDRHIRHTPTVDTRHVSGPTIDRVPSYSYVASQPSDAMSALETMELLCEEADVPWTDGMLLAGCLAYGLGNYTKAMVWYQQILIQDSKHVEAMSNLAATLLALGRRDDALRNWSTAVKLRPSYFEAVEHLIGLLCTAQKAKEAVEMIDYVEARLKIQSNKDLLSNNDAASDVESDGQSRSSSIATAASNDHAIFDFDSERRVSASSFNSSQPLVGFGSSGYAIPGSENGRLLALIHAKGNMLYGLGDNSAAAASFETAVLIATGHRHSGIQGLIKRILESCITHVDQYPPSILRPDSREPILLSPEKAQQTAQKMFLPTGELPGLEFVSKGIAYKAAISTTSNSLLSLAKIYQDGMNNAATKLDKRTNGTREILALYYLSLSLQRSPSTANNVGILLASVPQTTSTQVMPQCPNNQIINYAGITPGSGIALALQYYNYGLNIDNKHAHLYTNLGSLLKDLGQLNSAIKMYEIAVQCDGNFDIALANLANAVKDQGRVADAITYYRRAVIANPDFAEAVCGLATALNSVCNWYGRGGVYADNGLRDRIHVDELGRFQEARRGCGWINRVVDIVEKQLREGEYWGVGTLTPDTIDEVCHQLVVTKAHEPNGMQQRFRQRLRDSLQDWSGKRWEGARLVRLIERAAKQIGRQWYYDRYKAGMEYSPRRYARPSLPTSLTSPAAPTVLPFHTFTTPLSAKQVRQISQRNALRISVAALRSPWLPTTVYPPPPPPSPYLRVGYVSSDFNNHPLAHLMQSIFGLHDASRVRAYCYATTPPDGSIHRMQIEREAPVFHDASTWSVERLVDQIVKDCIHVLVNLNGYTRGAKNEVFAVRPAPIQMSFMGFAGTLGAEWCDYVYADPISVLPKTLSPWRRNVDVDDQLHPDALAEDREDWVYAENVIFAKSTFFCVDHKQSAPDAEKGPPDLHGWTDRDAAWKMEQDRRWRLRKELFPTLSDNAVILGNFNQLYKIDPTTFRMYLRILTDVPNAILWLLRFPDVGEQNLKNFASEWAGEEVASRVVFTDVAPKGAHITRASVVDLFLDTPECNAHTTAADVIWSGTPIVTWARWDYKMCSRMASSIVSSAFPEGPQGDEARKDLLVNSSDQYEKQAIGLATNLRYPGAQSVSAGRGRGRLMDLRRMLWEGRWSSRLFDTRRWVQNLEKAYWSAWENWENGEGGDIWL